MSESAEAPSFAAESAADGDTVVGGAVLSLAARLAGGVFTAALTIFLARRLGVSDYGVFALALSIVALVELPSDFGIAVAIPRFLAEHRSDRQRSRELVADGIRLEMVGSLVFAGALAAAAGLVARAYHAPGLAGPLRALAIALVVQNLVFFFMAVFTGMRRQALGFWTSLIESAAELSATLVLVIVVGGTTAAAFGRAIGYGIGAAVGLVLTLRLLGAIPTTRRTHGHAGRLARYALPLSFIDGVYTLFTQIDTLLIGAFLTAGSVAFFQAPMRLITMLQYPGAAVATAVAPRLARSAHEAQDVPAFTGSIRLLTIVMVGVTVFTTIWADPVIRLTLGAGYGPAVPILRALAPYVFLSGAASLVSTSLNYLGGSRRRLPIAIGTVLVNLVLDVILIPQIGVMGGVVGSDVGLALYVIPQFALCTRMLGLAVTPHLVTLARCLIAGGASAGVLAAFGTHHLSLGVIVVGGAAGILVYAAALLLTGEVSRNEVASIAGAAVGRLRPSVRSRRQSDG